jgi:OMF family outer membrane factor
MIVNTHKSKQIFLFLIAISAFYTGNAQTWSLQQCIDTAQVHNKNLQISRNKIELGTEKQNEAKANLYPKINLSADYKYFIELPYTLMPQSAFGGPVGLYKEVQMGVPHNMGANVQLAMPLYNAQVYGAIEATKIASELNQLQHKKTEEQVFFDISNLYYNAQILIHQKEFIEKNLVNTEKLLNNLKLLHTHLMVKKSDVSKVELQKEQLTTQSEQVQNQFEQVINALKFLMGIPIAQNIQIEADIKNKNEVPYSNSVPVDLEITETQNKLLNSELSTLKASRIPTVSIFGNYGQTGFGYDKKPNDFLKFYPNAFAGLQVTVPLFNGTVTKHKINQKEMEIQNTQLQLDLITDQNLMLIDNAKRQRAVTHQTIDDTNNQIELANTVYNETLLQQKEGTATLTDVLMADNTVREAQKSYLNAIIDYLKADLELKKLTGNISLKN